MIEDLKEIREALTHYAKIDDGIIKLIKGFAYRGEKDENSLANNALAKLDAVIGRLDSEELLEDVAATINDSCPSHGVRWQEVVSLTKLDGYLNAKRIVQNTRMQAHAAINTIKRNNNEISNKR